MRPKWQRRRRLGWAMPARRCGWCGWYPPPVHGRADDRFIGHAPACPVKLYANVHTEQDVADQAAAIAAWSYAVEHLGMPQAPEWWRMATWSLYQRAQMIGAPWPVPDDTRELKRSA